MMHSVWLAAFLMHWFSWPDGSVLTNLVASAVAFAGGYVAALRHFRCRDCWRPGRVPVKGDVHHLCKKHAIQHGQTH